MCLVGVLFRMLQLLEPFDVLRASQGTDSGPKSFFAILKSPSIPRVPADANQRSLWKIPDTPSSWRASLRFSALSSDWDRCFPAAAGPAHSGLRRTSADRVLFFVRCFDDLRIAPGLGIPLMSGCESPEPPPPIVSSLEVSSSSLTHECNMGAAALFARGLNHFLQWARALTS